MVNTFVGGFFLLFLILRLWFKFGSHALILIFRLWFKFRSHGLILVRRALILNSHGLIFTLHDLRRGLRHSLGSLLGAVLARGEIPCEAFFVNLRREDTDICENVRN